MRMKPLLSPLLFLACLPAPPKTIDLMTTNQVGALFNSTPGQGFGLAFATVDRVGADGLASVGSWGWAGAYGSIYRVDP